VALSAAHAGLCCWRGGQTPSGRAQRHGFPAARRSWRFVRRSWRSSFRAAPSHPGGVSPTRLVQSGPQQAATRVAGVPIPLARFLRRSAAAPPSRIVGPHARAWRSVEGSRWAELTFFPTILAAGRDRRSSSLRPGRASPARPLEGRYGRASPALLRGLAHPCCRRSGASRIAVGPLAPRAGARGQAYFGAHFAPRPRAAAPSSGQASGRRPARAVLLLTVPGALVAAAFISLDQDRAAPLGLRKRRRFWGSSRLWLLGLPRPAGRRKSSVLFRAF